MTSELTIREIIPTDATAAAQLSGEFGYPVSKETMERRIAELQDRQEHAIFIAYLDDVAVGWIDVDIAHRFAVEPRGEIGGFVVSEKHRRGGIGKQLLARAEAWVRERGVKKVLVRSRISREAAHRFYRREGYAQVKTSAVFEKELNIR